jgi:hypothetical protein
LQLLALKYLLAWTSNPVAGIPRHFQKLLNQMCKYDSQIYFYGRNLSIQDEYEEAGYYYLNNFNDFFRSYGRNTIF